MWTGRYLLECLLVLPVLEGVDEGVDNSGHPGQDRRHHVQGRHAHLLQKYNKKYVEHTEHKINLTFLSQVDYKQ